MTTKLAVRTRPFVQRLTLSVTMTRRLLDTVLKSGVRAHQRRTLRELDDRMLHDLGLTRADVYDKATKPFWWA